MLLAAAMLALGTAPVEVTENVAEAVEECL